MHVITYLIIILEIMKYVDMSLHSIIIILKYCNYNTEIFV